TAGTEFEKFCLDGTNCNTTHSPMSGATNMVVTVHIPTCGGCATDQACGRVELSGRDYCGNFSSEYREGFTLPCARNFDFTISNSSDATFPAGPLTVDAEASGTANKVSLSAGQPNPGQSIIGTVSISEIGSICPT